MTIDRLILSRHSGKSYDFQKKLTQEQILQMVQAAHLAPSCYNDQPWNYIICDELLYPGSFKKALSCLVEANQQWAANASTLIIAVARICFRHNGKQNEWSAYDTGSASENLSLQATAMGLMAHQMAGFDLAKTIKTFCIPQGYTPKSFVAIGYEVEGAKSIEKERLPLDQIYHLGVWQNK